MRTSAWNLYHPAVPVCYLIAVLVLTMLVQYPPLAVLSYLFAIGYSFLVAGSSSTLKLLAWQVPMLLVVTVANPLFSASGSTELFRIGARAFYFEALAYGFTMGCVLAAVMMWFSNGNRMLQSDQVLLLGAKALPTVSLMVSMTLKLVPQFLRRGSQIHDAQAACTAANQPVFTEASGSLQRRKGFSSVDRASRQVSVLMGWGMEDSLDTADAMLARGWGSGAKRTTYESRSFRMADGLLLTIIVLLAMAAVACAVVLQSSFSFYPAIVGWGSPWLVVPAALLMAVPFALEGKEYLTWR